MSHDKKIIISSEDQVIEYLNEYINKTLTDAYTVEFKNWPIVTVRLKGEGYDSTITSDMAESIVDLQHALNRTYAQLVYGERNSNKLKLEERKKLRFKAKVKKGSSVVEVNLGEWMTTLINAMVGKMDPIELIATVGVAGLTIASPFMVKSYLNYKTENKRIESDAQARTALSQEETKRLDIVTKAMNERPELRAIASDFDNARHTMLKSVGDASNIYLSGVELDNKTATEIARTPRETSEAIQPNGNYTIQLVSQELAGKTRLKVKSVDNGREFYAHIVDNSLDQNKIKLLQKAEWDRSIVYLSINATELRGQITTASIVNVVEQQAS